MMFTYRSKGTNDDWTTDSVEADSKADALRKLDEIYGVIRDENGNPANSDMIKVELI